MTPPSTTHLSRLQTVAGSASSGSPLQPAKASPAPKARASAKREILAQLGFRSAAARRGGRRHR